MDAVTAAAIQSKLDHAHTHMDTMIDRTAPCWLWIESNTEIMLHREYPLQGLRVRQDDVTVWKH